MAAPTWRQLRLPIGNGANSGQQLGGHVEEVGIIARREGRVVECKRLNTSKSQRCRLAPSSSPRLSPRTCSLVLLAFGSLILSHLVASSRSACLALKVTVSIPELVKVNDAFWLNCTHNSPAHYGARRFTSNTNNQLGSGSTQNDSQAQPIDYANYEQIYSIRWYKDEEEFYSFVPRGDPRVSYYETKGVQPDKTKTSEGNVFLTKADLNTEGIYRCEILSEGPVFETVRKSKHLKVFVLPVKSPRIEILDSNGKPKNPRAQEIAYEVGDKIELRCNSAPSKPPARLRWYLNDREVFMPGAHSTDRQGRTLTNQQALGYNVNVTQIEHRVHYKSIQSSHSTLSLLLEREDLVNSRISFKCLASIRQDVPIASKQLIVLTPQSSSPTILGGSNDRVRVARSNQELIGTSIEPESESRHGVSLAKQQRHRAQYNNNRLSMGATRSSQMQAASRRASTVADAGDLINSWTEDNQMMYVYEESDATFGPSIIDSPETLAAYLGSLLNDTSSYAPLEFNRADNLDYVQQIRDKLSRQRSIPGAHSASSSNKRLYGHHTLVKSPFYLDEYDAFRPVINWPPLDSGKLMLLPPSHSIVAIPTTQTSHTGADQTRLRNSDIKFVMPPKNEMSSLREASSFYANKFQDQLAAAPTETSRIILDQLIENLNCTCSEANLDTKLRWVVNDKDLNDRDVRHYPTRVSPDHRQTWMSIGLQSANIQLDNKNMPNSMASILSHYYRLIEAQARSANGQAAALRSRPGAAGGGQQVPIGNEQLKFMCQAQHSMLLYSSSEMITFDFNPPVNDLDGNRIDKFASLPSNVIQAATASTTRSKSSSGWTSSIVSSGSQNIIAAISMVSSIHILSTFLTGTLSL